MTEPSTAASVLKGLAKIPAPVVKAAIGFVESLLGEPLKVAGSAIADQVEMWKWANRVRMAARAQEILKEEKVAARVVAPAFLLPVIEAAGYTDDPTLQEMWARLLAAGVKDDRKQQPMLVRILRDFSPGDARFLKQVHEHCAQGDQYRVGVVPGHESYELHAAARLEALGVVNKDRRLVSPQTGVLVLPDSLKHSSGIWTMWMTDLGRDFVKVVSG